MAKLFCLSLNKNVSLLIITKYYKNESKILNACFVSRVCRPYRL